MGNKQQIKIMKVFLTLLALCAAASADDFDLSEAEADPRLFFVNFTSSLVAVNTTLLAYGLIFLAIVGGNGWKDDWNSHRSNTNPSGFRDHSDEEGGSRGPSPDADVAEFRDEENDYS